MKADHDEPGTPGAPAGWVRGRYAGRLSAAEREESQRRAWPAMVQELSTYTMNQVQELEAALFSFFVLAGQEPVQKAARHAAALLDAAGARRPDGKSVDHPSCELGDPGLLTRLQEVAAQRGWVQQQPVAAPEQDRESLEPVLRRLESIYNEARSLREHVEQLVAEHLARAGMSAGEIERKADETAKLWRAA
jgi:nucleotide-binding universal stress UspA family protein